jgi:hypothetical protein
MCSGFAEARFRAAAARQRPARRRGAAGGGGATAAPRTAHCSRRAQPRPQRAAALRRR